MRTYPPTQRKRKDMRSLRTLAPGRNLPHPPAGVLVTQVQHWMDYAYLFVFDASATTDGTAPEGIEVFDDAQGWRLAVGAEQFEANSMLISFDITDATQWRITQQPVGIVFGGPGTVAVPQEGEVA